MTYLVQLFFCTDFSKGTRVGKVRKAGGGGVTLMDS